MLINKKIIREYENSHIRFLPEDLKRYLLVKYAEEPFPYEYSEEDLYHNIGRDIRKYKAGELDVTIKSPSERWQEEREYLHNLYCEQFFKVRELEDYVAELEHMLSEHGLESSRMSEWRKIQF